MKKRMLAILIAFSVLYGSVCWKMYKIATAQAEAVNSTRKQYTITAGEVRGIILDCNGERLVSCDYENIVAAKPTYKALAELQNVLDAESYKLISQRMKNSTAVSVSIGKQELEENRDFVVMRKYFRYDKQQVANHIIGYLDGEGRGVCGIEKSFDELLYTGKNLSASFGADVYGRVLSGTQINLNNADLATGEVMLTIDRRIQEIVEKVLDEKSVMCGGAVVVETESGAIRAIASRPDFKADKIAEYIDDSNSPLLNRALNAYSVGSVFKVLIAAVAIENGLSSFSYDCNGSVDVDGTVFACNKNTQHGKIDITKALECSCNTFFISLAEAVGADKILETASLMGFGQEITLAEGIVSKAGVFPSKEELESSGAFANFSFGQGKFTATMLQLSNMMSAVAGKGKYHKPYLVEKVTDAEGTVIQSHNGGYPVYALSSATCNKLIPMLISVIENGNAQEARLRNNISAAGKTATAQTGIYNRKGIEECNTWFAGFFPAENPRYTIVVLKEGGASGATDCAPVFKGIADQIMILEKNS